MTCAACNVIRYLLTYYSISPASLPPDVYLNRLCPLQGKEEEREPSEPPGGAVSLSKLKALPVTTQVYIIIISLSETAVLVGTGCVCVSIGP